MSPPAPAAPVLVVEHDDVAPLGRLDPLGAPADLRRPHAGDPLPADLSGHSAVLVLGGQMAAWEDDAAPWLPATRALMARAVEEEVPLLGICLGAQLLAMAAGGRAERGGAGPEAGLLAVVPTAAAADDALVGPLAAAAPGGWLAAQSHGDAVTALPPGAVVLARSAAYPVQAFRVGRCAWGVQYHPEVTPGQLGRWLEGHRADLAARGTSAEQELARAAAREEELAALAEHHRAHLLRAARQAAPQRTGAGAAR